ncbi:tail fiber domain-containing protein [Sorangium sp. So ce117]|uniref:tail fiber domain-containing protein n=1 Tax=Sorangium sp. So ce117 TaxID=3133277 RepID=UPI003F604A10
MADKFDWRATTNQLSRTYYYDGELLIEDDFNREQKYLRDLIRQQNLFLFGPGVVSGLELSWDADNGVTVTLGMAFDYQGRPLILDYATQGGTSYPLNVGELESGTTYTVYIAYGEDPDDDQSKQAGHSVAESVQLAYVKASDSVPTDPNCTDDYGVEMPIGIVLGTFKTGQDSQPNGADGSGRESVAWGPESSTSSPSDAALKVEVSPIDGALARVAKLNPVSFAWRSDPARRRRLGLVAQEVAGVVPEIVGENAAGLKTVAYQELVPLLIRSIQELSARVAELEAEGARRGGGRG